MDLHRNLTPPLGLTSELNPSPWCLPGGRKTRGEHPQGPPPPKRGEAGGIDTSSIRIDGGIEIFEGRYREPPPGRLSGSIGNPLPFFRKTAVPVHTLWGRTGRDRRSFGSELEASATSSAFRVHSSRRAHLRGAMDASEAIQEASPLDLEGGRQAGRGGTRRERTDGRIERGRASRHAFHDARGADGGMEEVD